ncbi:MAG: transposase [Dehalococcoidia bacterium]|nr:transposase [Dehalococcoidia bacterium]
MKQDKQPRRQPTRLKDFDYAAANKVFFLTLCSRDGQLIFTHVALNADVIECIKEERKRVGHAVYVYCIMPDHLHLLSSPLESGISVIQFMGGLSSKITRLLWKYGVGRGKQLQRSFYDHVVRKEENLRQVAEYILNNPVRKGLVAGWEDYPFCDLLDPLPL